MSDFRTIPLTRGLEAIVDAADYDAVAGHTWCARRGQHTHYATRRVQTANRARNIHMHRVILGVDLAADQIVDHVNGNGLDNRRSNLRPCTHAQNMWNARRTIKSQSGFRGVRSSRRKWRATIRANGVCHCLGHYCTPEDAARAYDSAALRLHGEFATLNFPEAG